MPGMLDRPINGGNYMARGEFAPLQEKYVHTKYIPERKEILCMAHQFATQVAFKAIVDRSSKT